MKIKTANIKGILTDKTFYKEILKGCLFALILTLFLVLILGIIVKFVNVSDQILMPINQIIKVLSVFVGTLIAIKQKSNGAIKGLLIGLIYTLLSVFVFLILGGKLSDSFSYVDVIFGAVIGSISGIIAVNVGKNKI